MDRNARKRNIITKGMKRVRGSFFSHTYVKRAAPTVIEAARAAMYT
jgi:hypothetical protein